jgi:hypothetical protein
VTEVCEDAFMLGKLAVEFAMSGGKELSILEDHFDDVFVAMVTSVCFNVGMENEDVHGLALARDDREVYHRNLST